MRMQAAGEVWLECVITVTGECANIRILRSADPVFGLDEEALNTVRQWRFTPGLRQRVPVPVQVLIALEFSLK